MRYFFVHDKEDEEDKGDKVPRGGKRLGQASGLNPRTPSALGGHPPHGPGGKKYRISSS